MKWNELLGLAGYEGTAADPEVLKLELDSRKVEPGSVFFCIRGEASDGHKFAAMAAEKGACALVCEEALDIDLPQLIVEDSRLALAQLAEAWYGFPHRELKILAVTGTNGKTTTTHLVKHILDAAGKKTALMGTNHIIIGEESFPATHTTPDSLQLSSYLRKMADAGCEYLIMEASSHALKQGRVAAIDFKTAGFTNLTQDHLDYHKTFEDYLKAKEILFIGLDEEKGRGIVNFDSEYGKDFLAVTKAPVWTYGLSDGADLKAENITVTADGTAFDLVFDGQVYPVKINLIGDFNVYNSLTAMGMAAAEGIPMEDVVSAIGTAHQVKGRFEKVKEQFGPTVIIDYAHTPDGLENILKTAEKLRTNRVILVFGCGGDRDKTKRPIMGKIGGTYADYSFVTSDNPRTEDPMAIIRMVEEGIKESGAKYEVCCDRRDAIRNAILMAEDDDIVVVAGKGHEDYQIIGTEKIHFDDFEEVKEALKLC
ncbi:MAG: UDP-N-acetylmuramoyl-L-alanyl-D-glutamate--2,6-diaminopimelate ligase [Firmicutes bacterium]|nr:UDP-N-acetylmuramoyl-L-alanyl-D-glutamate--2,6-diaminopimelate ligase [Bacillota bacterium]